MSNITKDQVIEWLSAQTVLDLATLVKDLEGKWGVSAAAAVAAAATGGAANEASASACRQATPSLSDAAPPPRASRRRPPRSRSARSRPRTSGAVMKLPFEIHGLAPTQRRYAVRSRSGIGIASELP